MIRNLCITTTHKVHNLGHPHRQATGIVVFFVYSMALLCALMGCLAVPSQVKNFLNRGYAVRAVGGCGSCISFPPFALRP